MDVFRNDLTPAQTRTLRRALVFAIFLALMDIAILGALLYLGVIDLPR